MKKLFLNADGTAKYGVAGLVFAAFTALGVAFLGKAVGYEISHRFFVSGLIAIVGPLLAIGITYLAFKKYQTSQDGISLMKAIGFSAILFWATLFGPATTLQADRSSNIPDTSIYYNNGKVLNATDSSKQSYYFKHVKLNEVDSAYIVQYNEEPGYNVNRSDVRNGTLPKSTAPRANEDWTRPALVEHVDNY